MTRRWAASAILLAAALGAAAEPLAAPRATVSIDEKTGEATLDLGSASRTAPSGAPTAAANPKLTPAPSDLIAKAREWKKKNPLPDGWGDKKEKNKEKKEKKETKRHKQDDAEASKVARARSLAQLPARRSSWDATWRAPPSPWGRRESAPERL